MRRILVFVGLVGVFALAMAQPRKLPVKTPVPIKGAVIPFRKPVVVIPKRSRVIIPRLPVASGTSRRVAELADASGKHKFEVTFTASKAVDVRVLDYLAKATRIVELTAANRTDLGSWQKHAGPGKPGHDVTIVLASTTGARVADFIALPPDGVELIRPGVVRVRDELVAGLAKQRAYKFASTRVGKTSQALTEGGHPLQGTLKCRAVENQRGAQQTRELPFVKVKVGDVERPVEPGGRFELPGSFRAGSITLEIVYDSSLQVGDASATLRVMGEFHDARSESVTRTARLEGDKLDVGDIVLTSVDCEIWRLGAAALADYLTVVKKAPPHGGLRLKRWAGVWDGTPYTYYDHIVLSTNFSKAGRYRDESDRRGTIFHEFGHSVRHVADGDEVHWGWDNFRWAYARVHNGCDTFNVQEAFNEGWAGYWANTRVGDPISTCDANDSNPRLDPSTDKLIDWTEAKIARHLLRLANALSSDPLVSAPKMVEVLERSRGAIHSIREFETRYCQIHRTSSACRNGRPTRAEPAACPPNYHNDGATCRLENILAKESYGRGVGTVPTSCGPGKELDGGLCYRLTGVRGDRTLTSCRQGFSAVGPVCWQDCPSGFRDDGAFCAKPAPYGRGAGYPWEFGDAPFDLTGAKNRCNRDHAAGCEQDGLLFYPKCKRGFHAVGCCVCTPDCPDGMADIGVSCQKQSYGRGAGTVPTSCSGGQEYDTGLCYQQCRAGFDGVGPVCWKRGCPTGYEDHGATCYREPHILVRF